MNICENKHCNQIASECWNDKNLCFIHYLLARSKDKLEDIKK
tara:strand:+ start:333 stop:458 length:126 start_codon:yes stop_codon:yes gene_type:complete